MSDSDSGHGTTTASDKTAVRHNQWPSNETATEQQKLMQVSTSGDLSEVKRLVEECHVKLESCFEDNLHRDTPLHLAAYHGRLNVVKYLIEKAIYDVECRNRFENTPLHRAARQGHLHVVKYLIKVGKSDPICTCNWNRIPLHNACQHGRLEVVKYLMKNKRVDPFAKESRYGLTPLDLAAQYGALEVVQYMIEEKKCHEGQKEGSNTPLHQAAFGGRLEVVKYLIDKKVYDPMCEGGKGRTPLHSACQKNQLEVVKYYMDTLQVKLDSSCQYDKAFHMNPLDMAAEHGALDVVKYMVEEKHCAVEQKNYNSVLHQAAYGGQLEVVQYLINKGHCDPSYRGRIGQTPLHSACRNGKNNVVDYLIGECDVDTSTPDDLGNTPLHSAVKSGDKSVVELLVSKFDCDPEVVNNAGSTPAEDAHSRGHKDISEYLTSFKKISSNELRVSLKNSLKMHISMARPTGKVLGRGSYGSVIELRTDKGLVAGKVFNIISESATRMLKADKIVEEIKTLSILHHQNIVASKGVCFLLDKMMPVLLMEMLMSNLHAYLVHPDNSNLPVERKVSILHDTASGLYYLHSRTHAIIHRDLTAKNVLLDSELRAKIADFGNCRIMDLDPNSGLGTLTSLPGTLEYMPPEAQGVRVTYDPSLDVFSFGHLSLFTITQTPVQLLPSTYHDDSTGQVHARSEVKRRVEATEQLLLENQSLVALIEQCLHNNPAQRPHTGELLTRLQEMMTPEYFKKDVPHLKTCSLPVVKKYFHFADALELSFLRPIEVVTLTNGRKVVTIENEGISIHIPDDAVPVGKILNIEVGSAMYGKLSFPGGMRPVSSILWICPQEEMDLLKPFKITVPHTVKYEKGVTELFFLKACHNEELPMNTQLNQLKVFNFQFEEITHHKGMKFKEREGSVYTMRFCCVCIAENVRRPTQKRYLLHRTQPRYRNSREFAVDYCITFDMPHCVKTFNLFCENKELNVRCGWPEFTFDSGQEVQLTPLLPTPGWTVDIQCEKTKIAEKDVDFWKYDRERLGELENQRRYPPKITLEFNEYQAVGPSKVGISFTGAVASTVEPLYSGHHWGMTLWPL